MAKTLLVLSLLLPFCPADSRKEGNEKLFDINPNSSAVGVKYNMSNIKIILGEKRASGIAKASQVNLYHVKPFVRDTAAALKEEGKRYFLDYEVISLNKVDKKGLRELKKSLLDVNNYVGLEYVNKCLFTATIGMELVSKQSTVKILVSYPCNSLLFIEDGRESYRDLKSIRMLHQIAQRFLKDLPNIE